MNTTTKTVEGKEYKVHDNGTYYHKETSDEMIDILEKIRADNTRCRFHWGDSKTGEDWGGCFDVKGTIGRSTGIVKTPILIYNKKSFGGTGILTHCIVKITTTKGNKIIYQHPKYYLKNK